jgi:peptide-methionine (R)-S-oxide reductase
MTTPKIEKTDAQWREELTPEQYRILREHETERPGTSEYLHVDGDGMFHCAGCHAPLFSTDTKFESGSGWPSFYEPAVAEAVELRHDNSHGMIRTEVRCANCGGHLGHVFDDGPQPTGLRYCINGCALDLQTDQ